LSPCSPRVFRPVLRGCQTRPVWYRPVGPYGAIERLQQAGYQTFAPANPLRGLPTDAPYLASVLKSVTGPIVLVGHSYGGAVITNAAAGLPNVKALVYIAAFVPTRQLELLVMLGRRSGKLAEF
jgi:pimeloyl-ACP methyl ester carboxylesterase